MTGQTARTEDFPAAFRVLDFYAVPPHVQMIFSAAVRELLETRELVAQLRRQAEVDTAELNRYRERATASTAPPDVVGKPS